MSFSDNTAIILKRDLLLVCHGKFSTDTLVTLITVQSSVSVKVKTT